MSKKKTLNWKNWAVAVIFAVIILLAVRVWSTYQNAQQSELTSEYNKYAELANDDNKKLIDLYNQWVDVYNNAIEDGQLTDNEILQIENAINEYSYQYKIAKQHLISFKNFIVNNENNLKALNIDTFEAKRTIDDNIIIFENNIDKMVKATKNLVLQHEERQQELNSILQTLLGLL